MLRDFARRMRRDPTQAERQLWYILRSRRLAGFKFRRQVPVGTYIADFLCFETRLIVEADGGQHVDAASDAIRTAWLATNGFRVLRFWNAEILGNPTGVGDAILAALDPSP
ncbi:MAG: endonuclease domain-containing protein [Rhodospirillales bacterium]|nr:endonuclease domain-containing protein [Rhodospirillales bacterium]